MIKKSFITITSIAFFALAACNTPTTPPSGSANPSSSSSPAPINGNNGNMTRQDYINLLDCLISKADEGTRGMFENIRKQIANISDSNWASTFETFLNST